MISAPIKPPIAQNLSSLPNTKVDGLVIYLASRETRSTNLSPVELITEINRLWGSFLPTSALVFEGSFDLLEKHEDFMIKTKELWKGPIFVKGPDKVVKGLCPLYDDIMSTF